MNVARPDFLVDAVQIAGRPSKLTPLKGALMLSSGGAGLGPPHTRLAVKANAPTITRTPRTPRTMAAIRMTLRPGAGDDSAVGMDILSLWRGGGEAVCKLSPTRFLPKKLV